MKSIWPFSSKEERKRSVLLFTMEVLGLDQIEKAFDLITKMNAPKSTYDALAQYVFLSIDDDNVDIETVRRGIEAVISHVDYMSSETVKMMITQLINRGLAGYLSDVVQKRGLSITIDDANNLTLSVIASGGDNEVGNLNDVINEVYRNYPSDHEACNKLKKVLSQVRWMTLPKMVSQTSD